MLWRRDVLEDGGGIAALGAEIAEDAASTKLVRRAGLSAHLVDAPFAQPLGPRRFRDVWARQLRWARLRRATFAPYFALELLTTSLFVIAAAPVAAPEFGLSPSTGAALAALVWYGSEGALAARRGLGPRLDVADRLDRARSSAALALAARLERQPLRVARQRDVGRRGAARRGVAALRSAFSSAYRFAPSLPAAPFFAPRCSIAAA